MGLFNDFNFDFQCWTCHNTSIFILFKINYAGQVAMQWPAEPAEGAKKDGSFSQILVLIWSLIPMKILTAEQKKKKFAFKRSINL